MALPFKTNNNATRLRREILIKLASLYRSGDLLEKVDRVPLEMRPRETSSDRCCVYKDRAILKYRLMSAMGFTMEDEKDELTSLSEYAERALERETVNGPVLSVIDVACSACIQSRYLVTDACRGCLAHPCILNCPKQAISHKDGHAWIDVQKCINCGRCEKSCPYHAIVRVPIPCEEACPVGAIHKDDETGKEHIDYEKCIFCGKCRQACPFGAVIERSQMMDVLKHLSNGGKVVAMVAPAIIGQFPGDFFQIVSSLIRLGFSEVVEVAMGAEITAVREAEELKERMGRGERLMTTSCCPAYVEAAKKHLPELVHFISDTATPMHYTAEKVKSRNSDAVTVFIGPCLAKRNEALGDELVDYVLTFEEVGAMFVAYDIDVGQCEPSELACAVTGEGRGFPVSGGVAAAVKSLLSEEDNVKTVAINGLDKKSMNLLKIYAKKACPGNMLEVMACEGGCIAGPGVIADPRQSQKKVEAFIKDSPHLNKDCD